MNHVAKQSRSRTNMNIIYYRYNNHQQYYQGVYNAHTEIITTDFLLNMVLIVRYELY